MSYQQELFIVVHDICNENSQRLKQEQLFSICHNLMFFDSTHIDSGLKFIQTSNSSSMTSQTVLDNLQIYFRQSFIVFK